METNHKKRSGASNAFVWHSKKVYFVNERGTAKQLMAIIKRIRIKLPVRIKIMI